MRKFLLVIFVVLLSAGCATKRPPVQYFPVSIPELNETKTAYLGDKLLTQATGYYGNSLKLGNASGVYSVIKAGVYCKLLSSSERYWSNDSQAVSHKNLYGQIINFSSFVTYDQESNEVCPGSQGSGCYSSSEISSRHTEKDFCSDPNSFQRIIEYNGKTGNILNFTYREFSDDMARQAYTTDFKMDLSDGDTISYKGAVLKITEADNNQITYSVSRNFNK